MANVGPDDRIVELGGDLPVTDRADEGSRRRAAIVPRRDLAGKA
jgi:hypothetical protein